MSEWQDYMGVLTDRRMWFVKLPTTTKEELKLAKECWYEVTPDSLDKMNCRQ